MNLTAYELALIAGGLGMVGSLAGAWAGYRFTIALSDRNELQNASRKLREAFYDELATLEGGSIKNIQNIISFTNK